MLPVAKTEGMIVEELAGETLVYDNTRKKAHCLNPTAALVWRSCDGHTSVGEIAERLRTDLGAPGDPRLVELALSRLEAAKLVEARSDAPRLTRRELATRLGLAGLALLLPVVTTINAPAAAQAASGSRGCIPQGGACGGALCFNCCGGLECRGTRCGGTGSPC
jgi:hypothetical protein